MPFAVLVADFNTPPLTRGLPKFVQDSLTHDFNTPPLTRGLEALRYSAPEPQISILPLSRGGSRDGYLLVGCDSFQYSPSHEGALIM